jgi:hypothetical protein
MGGVGGRPVGLRFGPDGRSVIASSDGLGRCDSEPSRRISPYVRSAWIKGTSSTLSVRASSWSIGPPRASKPDTIDSHGSCGSCSGEPESGAMTSWTSMSLLSPKRKSPNEASASRPVARLVICSAPLILTNLAGEPSGSRSLSLTFWCEVVWREPRHPATHSRSIIQSLTYV